MTIKASVFLFFLLASVNSWATGMELTKGNWGWAAGGAVDFLFCSAMGLRALRRLENPR